MSYLSTQSHRWPCMLWTRHCRSLLIFLVLWAIAGHAVAEVEMCTVGTSEVAVIPADGFNLRIAEQLHSHYLIMTIDSSAHNWFAGIFTNLPIDKEVTIGFSLDGLDTAGNVADVGKWRGLRPVMTVGDPLQYTTYSWYAKDEQGRWVCGDPFAPEDMRFAGTDVTPVQSVIPAEFAERFLSADGTYWQPWREIDGVEAYTSANVFRMRQTFASHTATLAMRIPFTYTYLQQLLERLEAAAWPGVTVEAIGETPEGRLLQVIALTAPAGNAPPDLRRPTVLVYAGEHATEHDAGWGAVGMLHWLLSADPAAMRAREQVDWLIIPMLDPDAAAQSVFHTGDDYRPMDPVKAEAVAYATWLVERLDAGKRLDLVVNLHNVECDEGPNLFSPFVNIVHADSVQALHTALFTRARAEGYTVGQPQGWEQGMMGLRLGGWCFRRFRSYDLTLEINTRHPTSRLTLARTQELGALIARQVADFVCGSAFPAIMREIDRHLAERAAQRDAYWTRTRRTPATRNSIDLFIKGY